MKWLINTLAASFAGGIAWWLGAKVGIMTAFFLSTIASGVALYYSAKWIREHLP